MKIGGLLLNLGASLVQPVLRFGLAADAIVGHGQEKLVFGRCRCANGCQALERRLELALAKANGAQTSKERTQLGRFCQIGFRDRLDSWATLRASRRKRSSSWLISPRLHRGQSNTQARSRSPNRIFFRAAIIRLAHLAGRHGRGEAVVIDEEHQIAVMLEFIQHQRRCGTERSSGGSESALSS
jgi:hypothetical protein